MSSRVRSMASPKRSVRSVVDAANGRLHPSS
ncbi:hypothetical protein M3J09_009250 [Ascochyta lentis]